MLKRSGFKMSLVTSNKKRSSTTFITLLAGLFCGFLCSNDWGNLQLSELDAPSGSTSIPSSDSGTKGTGSAG